MGDANYIREEFIKNFNSAFNKLNEEKSTSLRSFAKKCGISPSLLSMIAKGKRNPSAESIGAIGAALPIDMTEAKAMRNLAVLASKSANPHIKDKIEEFFHNTTEDVTGSMDSLWYVQAIKYYTRCEGWTEDYNKLASVFGITTKEAKSALDYLRNFERITKGIDGKYFYYKTHENYNGDSSLQRKNMLKSYRAMIERELEILDYCELTGSPYLQENYFCYHIAPIKKEKVHEVKTLIRAFARQLMEHLDDKEKGSSDEVYAFFPTLLPLSNSSNEIN